MDFIERSQRAIQIKIQQYMKEYDRTGYIGDYKPKDHKDALKRAKATANRQGGANG